MRNENGQGLIEYLILTALVAVAAMSIVGLMGESVRAKFAEVTNALQGRERPSVDVRQVDAADYSRKDMGDFLRGAVKQDSGRSDRR